MLKEFLFILTFFCLISSSLGQKKLTQEQVKDSVQKIIDLSALEKNPVKIDSLFKQALNLTINKNLDSLTVDIYLYIIDNEMFGFDNGEPIKLGKSLKNLYTYSKNRNYINGIAEYYKTKGHYFKDNIFQLDSAYYYFHKSKELLLNNKNFKRASTLYIYLLETQSDVGDDYGVEQTAIEALPLLEQTNDYDALCNVYMRLGLKEQKFNLENGLKFYEKAKSYNDKVKSPRWKEVNNLKLNIQISYSYINKGKFKKALEHIIKAEEIILNSKFEENDFQKRYITVLENKGICLISLNQIEEGLKNLKKAYELCPEKAEHQKSEVLYDLAYYYFYYENDIKKGSFYGNKCLEIAKKINYTSKELDINDLFAGYYKGEKAIPYLKKVISLKDSLAQKEANVKDKFALVRFETKRKSDENILLKQQNITQDAQLENTKQKNKIILLISGFGIFVLFLLIVSFVLRQKSLSYKRNLEKAEAREEERKEISKVLHDKISGDLRMIYQKSLKKDIPEISEPLFIINQEVRNLSHKLSTINFYEIGFKDQVINLVSDYYSPTFKIKLIGINNLDWSLINTPIKRTLYLVTRECIQNSNKHSNASELKIEFSTDNKKLSLKISDNGIGFDVDSPKYGLGLKSQKSRVEELNGLYSLKSILNIGTTTTVNLPLTNI